MSAPQRNEAWVKKATPEEIDRAYSAGELDWYTGGMKSVPAPTDIEGVASSIGVSPTDLAHMSEVAVNRMIRDAHEAHPEWSW